MKEGSLFCSYEIHRDASDRVHDVFGSSRQGGVHRLGSMTFGLAVQ